MKPVSKIRRQGGAAIVTIPPSLLKQLDAAVGTELSLRVSGGELVARPLRQGKRRYSLEELLEGSELIAEINAEAAEAMEGDPVGREL
jgi:antitoxin ChpS